MNPKYPIYVISKGRWEARLTVKALELRGIPYHLVIEPQEYDQYAAVVNPISNLGQGSIPARNWVWEHSIEQGAARHWILDDNIRNFFRLYKNDLFPTTSGTSFATLEDWADRYTNMALVGMQYLMFSIRKVKTPPLIMNTRIYSCILIQNDITYRWRGRYNEDTDLSLCALKDGYCTMLSRAFIAEKNPTMRMAGGNTDELYQGDGRLKMAQSLQAQHPDVTKIAWKWGRWQHQVDYRPFKNNRPILRKGVVIPDEPNNYGMKLVKRSAPEMQSSEDQSES